MTDLPIGKKNRSSYVYSEMHLQLLLWLVEVSPAQQKIFFDADAHYTMAEFT